VGQGWAIKHSAADYKTGGVYGDRPPLELDADLYPILEDYVANYRCVVLLLTLNLPISDLRGLCGQLPVRPPPSHSQSSVALTLTLTRTPYL
jgi:hypothetical protein